MEEQSHKDEMRAALRGDFERMRRRQAPEATEATEPAPPMSAEEPKLVRQEARGKPWLDRLLGRG